ncbi:Nucleoporin Ndc1 [Pseudolycoriella hygida]|uniref:Nucleoporin Ndc1 n=1 Tax=Pseudolycoriella hygida TaxID=35572 RepID=A0A9Q0N8F4_9DIPT|nr:Nucleoporin Ndc1 [Pseudolycoriella hygida]
MSKEQICRRICNIRFVEALMYSAALQLLLLTTIVWLVPLLAVVLLYGICIGHEYLRKPHYYPTRALWIYYTAVRTCTVFAIHVFFGIVTSWMHSNYANAAETEINEPSCEQSRYCANETSLMSILCGVYVSSYYFYVKGPTVTDFFIIHQNIYIRARSSLVTILRSSAFQSVGPLFTYLLFYVALGSSIKFYISAAINIDFQDASVFNVRQVFDLWIMSTHILCNMSSISALFKICIEKSTTFPVMESQIESDSVPITLNDALASEISVVQKLASCDLFTLASSSDATRRLHIFALSIPGGHPYSWISLSTTCLQLMDAYCDQLVKSIEQIVYINKTNASNRLFRSTVPIGVSVADKVRFRQYNQNYGIRNMSLNGSYSTETIAGEQINDVTSKIKLHYFAAKTYILNLPGIYYFFGETFSSKIDFHLRDTETISWICQGLSFLAAKSLTEDKYGVVHNSLIPTNCNNSVISLDILIL